MWIGFVFALYRATMSRQWRDNGGITTATRRHREWPSLFPRLVFRSSGREGRKDARRKNERNNGFIISGLYRRAAFHCSTSFLPLFSLSLSSPPLLLHRRPGTSLKRAETLSCCAFRRRSPLIDTGQEAFLSSYPSLIVQRSLDRG